MLFPMILGWYLMSNKNKTNIFIRFFYRNNSNLHFFAAATYL